MKNYLNGAGNPRGERKKTGRKNIEYRHLSNKDKMAAADRAPLANVRNLRNSQTTSKDESNEDLHDSDHFPTKKPNMKLK